MSEGYLCLRSLFSARVIKTRNGEFPLGTLVLAFSGWRTHFISKDGKDLQPIPFDLGSLSPSVTLGILGTRGYYERHTRILHLSL